MSSVKGSNATSDHNKPLTAEGIVNAQTEKLKVTMKLVPFLSKLNKIDQKHNYIKSNGKAKRT